VSTLGSYQLVERLGRGGMGLVWRAVHSRTGNEVALKTVDVGPGANLGALRREIWALARVRHPLVVEILDHDADGSVPWYAMEIIAGPSLASLVPRTELATRALTWSWSDSGTDAPEPSSSAEPEQSDLTERLAVCRDLCAALAFVHGEGIIHRDLKPENVLLRPDLTPVLADFGLAAVLGGGGRERLDETRSRTGTPAYMAPEQIRGEDLDARADLYSLGCLLYELVTGWPPFVGSFREVIRQHLEEPPVPPSVHVPGLSSSFDTLVLGLLEKTATRRIGFADDVAAALEALGVDPIDRGGPAPRPYLYGPGLAGREAELEVVRGHIDALASGGSAFVALGGESGIGKTRLANHAALLASRSGAMTLVGECGSTASGPRHGLRQILVHVADRCAAATPEDARRWLGDRGPVLASEVPTFRALAENRPADVAVLSPEASRARLLTAASLTLEAMASSQPLFLVLDDVQWADPLTVGFLVQLGSALPSRIFVLASYRPEEADPALRAVVGSSGVETLSLGRLDRVAVAAMARNMLALQFPGRLADYLADRSEGSPFMVEEYLRAAVEEGLVARDSGVWTLAGAGHLDSLGLPTTVRALVERRLRGLAPDARHVVDVAALVGREIEPPLLAEVAGLPRPRLWAALGDLEQRQVLVAAPGGRFRFAHDRIRELAAAGVDDAAARPLHLAIAAALQHAPGHLQAIARHLEAGSDLVGACRASVRALEVMEEGEISGQREMAELYLRHAPADTETSAWVQVQWAGALYLTGEVQAASDAFHSALTLAAELGADQVSMRARVGLAALLIEQLATDEAQILVRDLDATRHDAELQEQLAGVLAGIAWTGGDLDKAAALTREALGHARRRGSMSTALLQLTRLAFIASSTDPDEADRLYREAHELACRAGDVLAEAVVGASWGVQQRRAAHLDASVSLFERSIALYRRLGSVTKATRRRLQLAATLQWSGSVEAARAMGVRGVAEAGEHGMPRDVALGLVSLIRLAIRRGDLDHAGELIDRLEGHIDSVGPSVVPTARILRAEILLTTGRVDDAQQLVQPAFERALLMEDDIAVDALLVLARCDPAHRREHTEHARRVADHLRSPLRQLIVDVELCELLVEEGEDARPLLDDVVGRVKASGARADGLLGLRLAQVVAKAA
jgi:tetratricopeptide (TPR) repeat protein